MYPGFCFLPTNNTFKAIFINKMSNEAVIVIDVQNCFLPGGSLGTTNSRNSDMLPATTLGKSIANFINNEHSDAQIFVSKDYHTVGHSSF